MKVSTDDLRVEMLRDPAHSGGQQAGMGKYQIKVTHPGYGISVTLPVTRSSTKSKNLAITLIELAIESPEI